MCLLPALPLLIDVQGNVKSQYLEQEIDIYEEKKIFFAKEMHQKRGTVLSPGSWDIYIFQTACIKFNVHNSPLTFIKHHYATPLNSL